MPLLQFHAAVRKKFDWVRQGCCTTECWKDVVYYPLYSHMYVVSQRAASLPACGQYRVCIYESRMSMPASQQWSDLEDLVDDGSSTDVRLSRWNVPGSRPTPARWTNYTMNGAGLWPMVPLQIRSLGQSICGGTGRKLGFINQPNRCAGGA
jgi:hypothetical protein